MPIKTTAARANSLTFSTERLLSAFRDALGNGGEMRRPGAALADSAEGIDRAALKFIQVTLRTAGFSCMPVVNETVANGLAAYYEYVAVQLHQWVDPLSNEQFWRKPYAYGNSAGHLVLHVTGNLNYYGARVAETGYRRDRDREFTDKQPPPKDEALRAFDRAMAMVVATIRKQSPTDWGKAYTAEREPEAADRFQIFLRCAGHAYHHVGQIVYLSRELART